MLLILLFCSGFSATVAIEGQLKNVQVFFRHGDRTPLWNIPADPYQEAFWGLPWGSLTKIGLQQQFKAGIMLKSRYIDELQFVNATYSPYEVTVFSALQDRCLQSVAANFAGFYSESSFDPEEDGWPANWIPIPVHTYSEPDRFFEPGDACPRYNQLVAQRALTPQYVKFTQQYTDFVELFANKTGEPYKTLNDVMWYVTVLACEKAHNLPFLPWITNDVWKQCVGAINVVVDYYNGLAQLGVPKNDEIIRLRAAPALAVVSDVLQKGNGFKYTVYSAHDTTILAILGALGPDTKQNVLIGSPDYAATMAIEKWVMDDGSEQVQLLYAANATSPLLPVTKYVAGCSEDLCLLDTFLASFQPYLVPDMETACAQQ